jgi:hypothetical protein
MSDDKKSEKKPLENPEIYVNVTPKDEKNADHKKTAEKVKEKLKENIRKAIEENKPGGKEKQFEAAESETKKAGRGANPSQIEKIKVRVAGKDGDNDVHNHEWTVTPKEGKPTP